MKKYNLSEIMTKAWARYRKFNAPYKDCTGKGPIIHSFGSCLKAVWAEAKKAVKDAAEAAKTGLRRMHYSEYKRDYSDCQTVNGSYDKATKTIEVMTLVRKGVKLISYAGKTINGLCPYCHTYCYGDCRAH